MTGALAHFLPDFDIAANGRAVRHQASRNNERPAGIPAHEVDRLCREAAEAARAELEAELGTRHAAELAALREQHQATLDAITNELADLAAQAIPQAVADRATGIADALAADVAAVLAPVVADAVAARMVGELADEIAAAASLVHAAEIRVSGPQALLDAVRARLGDQTAKLSLTETEATEVTVSMDGTRWTTRLQAWAGRLKEALQ